MVRFDMPVCGHEGRIMAMRKLLFGLGVLVCGLAQAATLRVNNNAVAGAPYTTIQAAISAAADGDTILVEGSGTVYAPFIIENKRLNLIGPGYRLSANQGTPANKLSASISNATVSSVRTVPTYSGTANGSLVAGLDFQGRLEVLGCSDITVTRSAFGVSSNSSSFISIASGAANVLVGQCFFGSSSSGFIVTGGGIRIENNIFSNSLSSNPLSAPVTIRNNLFLNSGPQLTGAACVYENNIFLGTLSTVEAGAGLPHIFTKNLFGGSLPSNIVGSGNVGSIYPDAVMASFYTPSSSFDSRFKLAPLNATNPAFNAGTDGSHIGPFGGLNPYVLSGVPPLPTIDELAVPQFATPGTPLSIQVKVSARP
jgi:hypothetical protein